MNHPDRWLWRTAAFLLVWLNANSQIAAQIIPDATLPNQTIALPNGNSIRIEGGTANGSNLFHSFQEFSVPTGVEAFFNNSLDIQNIFSRVTGSNISNIDGLIRANGTANLFLINPNGIIFGQNAQLNIGGSFIGSTASSIKFSSGGEFSATNPNSPSILNINVPIGLQFGINPKSIINRSQAPNLIPLPTINPNIPIPTNAGLQVLPGQTLALVGGDLTFDSGFATAFSGNIQLGSVASPGLVLFQISPTGLGLDYTNVASFGNIDLAGLSAVTASGLGGGAIAIKGGNVTLRDLSNISSNTLGNINGRDITIDATRLRILDRASILSLTTNTGNGGNVNLRATESVEFQGSGFDNLRQNFLTPILTGNAAAVSIQNGLNVGTLGIGNGGNIAIDTKQVTLSEGARINNSTSGAGVGGNIAIKASDSIDLNESVIVTPVFGRGNGGDITIDTSNLTIFKGALVSTGTFGAGNGGNLIVKASNSIKLSLSREDSPFGNGIGTNTVNNTGNAGNLEINTGSLLVESGSKITSTSGYVTVNRFITSAGRGGNIAITADSVTVTSDLPTSTTFRSLIVSGTTGIGQGGNVTINTRQLTVDGGSGIGANTLGAGNGGNITVNASESIVLSDANGIYRSGLATASGEPSFQALFRLPPPTGAAGSISVTTQSLEIRDGATIDVGSLGSGSAGNLNLVANTLDLDNASSINGTTGSGEGANINLQAQAIQLRSDSRIRTDAGTANGGNIAIDTDTLVALANSDITANAIQGTGGRVSITARGIFGTQFRDALTPQSDITATSDLGPQFGGTVTINTPDVEPASGLVELQGNFADVSDRIASACPATGGNSFTVTGRGGLPSDPAQTLPGRVIWRDVRALGNGESRMGNGNRVGSNLVHNYSPEAIEATGWQIDRTGEVKLVANASDLKYGNNWHRVASCGG